MMERYVVEMVKFHECKIHDNVKGRSYGLFDRFQVEQLQKLCDDLNGEHSLLLSAIDSERTDLGKSVLMQYAKAIGVDME